VVCLTVVALVRAWSTSNHGVVRPSRSSTDEFETASETSGANGSVVTHRGLDAIVATTPTGVRLATGWRGALTLIGAVVGGALLWIGLSSLAPVMVPIVVAVLIAVALNRPVSWVERRARVPRFVAIAAISLAGLAVVGAATVFAVAGGAQTSSELSSQVPTIADDLSTLPVVGPWLEDRDASVWLENQMENVPQRLQSGGNLADVLPSLGARLLNAAWTLIFAAALLVDGPRLAAAAERRIPVGSRRQAVRLRDASHRAVGGYLAGAALVAMINGMVVFGIAAALGIALAPVLAVWAFGWNFVPQIGGFMGGLPLMVFALAQGPTQAIVAGAVFLSYQLVENHLIQPAVISESIDVPPWVALLAALAGGAAGGLVGAVALTPLVGVVRVIVDQIHRDDFPGTTVQTSTSVSTPEL
jgi:predicted PurR-regulated permease PerM